MGGARCYLNMAICCFLVMFDKQKSLPCWGGLEELRLEFVCEKNQNSSFA